MTAVLRTYRVLSSLAAPLAPILLARRLKRGKENRARIGERRGKSRMPRPDGALIWLHAASVGELISALPLIERIAHNQLNMLVTSGTVTSSELAAQRLPAGVIHQFLPLDAPRFMRRFLNRWQPDLALFVESDLWPNMMIETSRRGVPMILINGRLSENSVRHWRSLPKTIANLLNRFDLCLARTPTDAAHLSELGAPRVITTGNLKLDVPPPPADAGKLKSLSDAVTGRPVIAAASTHAGEDAMVIEAHGRLRGNFPGLLTLIAPRHPERGPDIAEIAQNAGLSVALRSRGDLPTAQTDIYVADTMGELGLLYRLAQAVFMGGSLVRHGGQNPIEPAKLGAAILHGPHIWNFTEIYDSLDRARGAEPVADVARLTAGFASFLNDASARTRTTEAARATVDALGGAFDRTLRSLEPYLMNLMLRGRRNPEV
ncbi:MAG: 3-deoxy-D-manno-octulosonic acid transferase [Rhodopseudomonas sp.]|nr:3-deoxy-D-manno-octulosonic acid transferase [Rhodopseudomonas sp.]